MILSLIVPVYGVEKYILAFIESLASQITQSVEVVIVNDGTKDKSIELLKKYIDNLDLSYKDNIIFLDQNNQGQSIARNNGISHARGEYIGFIDPDDIVSENFISTITNNINKHPNVDAFHFNAQKISDNGNENLGDIDYVLSNEIAKNDEKYLKNLLKRDIWYPWLRVIRSEFFKEYCFPKGIILEDKFIFPMIYFSKVKEIKEIPENLVYYRIRIGSALNRKKDNHILYSLKTGMDEYKKYKDCVLYEVYQQYVWCYLYDLSTFKLSKIYYETKGIKYNYSKYLQITDMKSKILSISPFLFVLLLKAKNIFSGRSL